MMRPEMDKEMERKVREAVREILEEGSCFECLKSLHITDCPRKTLDKYQIIWYNSIN